MDKWLTLTEAGKIYKKNTSTLRRNIVRGHMFPPHEVKKIGHMWLIRKAALDREYGKRD